MTGWLIPVLADSVTAPDELAGKRGRKGVEGSGLKVQGVLDRIARRHIAIRSLAQKINSPQALCRKLPSSQFRTLHAAFCNPI